MRLSTVLAFAAGALAIPYAKPKDLEAPAYTNKPHVGHAHDHAKPFHRGKKHRKHHKKPRKSPLLTATAIATEQELPKPGQQTGTVPTTTATTATGVATNQPAGKTPFPYPSGATSVNGWNWEYSAPTQMTWTATSGAFQSEEHSTTYTITDVDSASVTHVRTTSTVEAACTPAASDYIESALTKHNGYRAEHSANPVVWDEQLACIAQRQAKSCIAEHLTYVGGGGYGQNLMMGTGTTVGQSVDGWYAEAPNFDPYYGEANPGGEFGKYGHFTQLVWAYTTSIGCGTFTCSGQELTLCNYFAGGNMGNFYGVYVLPKAS